MIVEGQIFEKFEKVLKISNLSDYMWLQRASLTKCLSIRLQTKLNFRYGACFEQKVPWHSGNYRVWIHSETRTWHDKNMQLSDSYEKTYLQTSSYVFRQKTERKRWKKAKLV